MNEDQEHGEWCDDPQCAVCGPEPTYEEWVAGNIGPRQVGGLYRTYDGYLYQVLEIEPGPRTTWPTWRITVRGVEDGIERAHCTAWDPRDQVVAEPGEAGEPVVLMCETRIGHKTWLADSVVEWPTEGKRAAAQAMLQTLEPNGREG